MSSTTSRRSITPSATDVISNSTAATAFAQYIKLPAYSLRKLHKIDFGGAVISTATNSTDTLTVQAFIGTALDNTGHKVFDSGALDVANNDVCAFMGWAQIKTYAGASSAFMTAFGIGVPKAAGTITAATIAAVEAQLDCTVDQYLCVVGTWSVASASNSCRLDALWADIFTYAN